MSDDEDLSGSSLWVSAAADGSPVESTVLPANSQFMRLLLESAPRGTYGWVCNFIGAPRAGADWGGRPYRGGGELEVEVDTWHPYNTYFSVAALSMGEGGEQARRKALFSRLLVLVVDDADIGELQGRPSYILQTSPGKCQVGIFLAHDDPDCANLGLVDALMRVLYERKLIGGDPSGNNGVRYVRLPVGTNLKQRDSGPFRHAMTLWSPEQRMTLADAASVVGVDIDELRERVAAQASAEGGMQLGPGAGQSDKLEAAVGNVVRGIGLHESLNVVAASLVGSGAHGGAVVNLLRALMTNSLAARDDRWQDRYADIPRAVRTAEQFRLMPQLEQPLATDVEPAAELQKPELILQYNSSRALRPLNWLIKGFLEAGAMSILFGPSGSCKSFVAIDQACCVATGTPWHGNPVKQGPVLIIVGEGGAGLELRLKAWEIKNGVSLDGAPLFYTTRAVPMLDAESAAGLVEAVARVMGDLKPSLVVIDTLARNFGPGDENSAKDASAFIDIIDAHIRLRYSRDGNLCHVMTVHHSGLASGRERGSTAFGAAMDQRFEVKRYGDDVEYINRKMKDGPEPATVLFAFVKGVDLGMHDDDQVLGAAISLKGNILDTKVASGKKGEITAKMVMELVAEDGMPAFTVLEKLLSCAGKTAQKAVRGCVELGLLEPRGKGSNVGYWVTEAGALALSGKLYQLLGGKVAMRPADEGEE